MPLQDLLLGTVHFYLKRWLFLFFFLMNKAAVLTIHYFTHSVKIETKSPTKLLTVEQQIKQIFEKKEVNSGEPSKIMSKEKKYRNEDKDKIKKDKNKDKDKRYSTEQTSSSGGDKRKQAKFIKTKKDKEIEMERMNRSKEPTKISSYAGCGERKKGFVFKKALSGKYSNLVFPTHHTHTHIHTNILVCCFIL